MVIEKLENPINLIRVISIGIWDITFFRGGKGFVSRPSSFRPFGANCEVASGLRNMIHRSISRPVRGYVILVSGLVAVNPPNICILSNCSNPSTGGNLQSNGAVCMYGGSTLQPPYIFLQRSFKLSILVARTQGRSQEYQRIERNLGSYIVHAQHATSANN